MSTAILISGQLRTFAQCSPTQRWHVYRHFPDCHFFLVVQRQRDAIEILTPLMRDFGSDHVHLLQIDDPTLEVTPEITSAFDLAPYANAAPAHQLLLQHWYQAEVWKHFLAVSSQLSAVSSEPRRASDLQTPPRSSADHATSEKADRRSLIADRFDTFIRIRPDQFFHSFDQPSNFDFSGRRGLNTHIAEHVAFTPWWVRFGGVNDRLAILGREAARAYFTVYEQIPALLAKGCPFHPESLVKAALLENGCTIHETLRTEFTTLRLDGNHRPPEIMSCDIAHAALRAAA